VAAVESAVYPNTEYARRFLRRVNLPHHALDRFSPLKQRFGAKLDKFCLRLMPWIAESHRTETAVSIFGAL
jgi:hypothetical protein